MTSIAQLSTDQLLHELTKASVDGYVLFTRGHRYHGGVEWRVQWRTRAASIVSTSQYSWREALVRAVEKQRNLKGCVYDSPDPPLPPLVRS